MVRIRLLINSKVLRKFAACSYEVKLRLFQAFGTSFYCAHLWYKFTKHVMSKVRVAYNNVSGFYLDIEEVTVPAKCLSPIIFITLKVACENILMILLCGLAAAVIYESPRSERTVLFLLVLSGRNGLGMYILFIISVVNV